MPQATTNDAENPMRLPILPHSTRFAWTVALREQVYAGQTQVAREAKP